MDKSDFIRNNYFLYRAGINPGELKLNNNFELSDEDIPSIIINHDLRQKINELTYNIPGTPNVEPTNEIINKVNPIDIGRFIAILYFVKMNEQLISYKNGEFKCWFNNGQEPEKTNTEILKSYIVKIYSIRQIKKSIKFGTKDKMDFYLLLYCLWYILKGDEGIDKYYQGIQDVFNITNKYSPNIYNICPVSSNPERQITFEEAIIKTTTTEFTVFRQERSRSFCDVDNNNSLYNYPDCGETTIRNLINLLCFDVRTGKFVINTLRKYNPIPQLVEYYSTFTDFNEQSNYNKKIYGLTLNARDAWSYLIIHFANDDLNFNEYCSTNSNHKFNIKASARTLVNTNINSLQLLKNLLGINNWDALVLVNSDILSVNSKLDNNGIGSIQINHRILGNTKITYRNGHAWWDNFESQNTIDIHHLDKNKQKIINILSIKVEISEANYLFFKYNENILIITNKDISTEIQFNLYKKMIEISLTDIINNEIRKQIIIEIRKEKVGEILQQYNYIDKINEYTYYCDNFDFVDQYIPQLKHINCKIFNNIKLTSINLSPLTNITSIGPNFLADCIKLTSINLLPLSNVTSIEENFLYNCNQLTAIDLSPLCKLTSIKENFLCFCHSLAEIDISALSNVTSISSFLSGCSGISIINLSALSNVTYISDFLSDCTNLRIIDLSPLSNVTNIGNLFLSNCMQLEIINLTSLSNVTSIGNKFLADCVNLKTIDLTPLSNVTSIGDLFLSNCMLLEIIDLTPLSNVTSIGNKFLADCVNLKTIDLSSLCHITSIDDNFLAECSSLEIIDLTPLSNIRSITNKFLAKCINLKSINLSSLVKLNSIGNNFLAECTSLDSIDLSHLVNLNSIGNHFLTKCTSLVSINLSHLIKLNSIENHFLYKCNRLNSINLSHLINLNSIGNYFLAECTSLDSIDLSHLVNLNSIGNHFLYNCTNLKILDMSQLIKINLNSIGYEFLAKCNLHLLITIQSQSINNHTYKGKGKIIIHDNLISKNNK